MTAVSAPGQPAPACLKQCHFREPRSPRTQAASKPSARGRSSAPKLPRPATACLASGVLRPRSRRYGGDHSDTYDRMRRDIERIGEHRPPPCSRCAHDDAQESTCGCDQHLCCSPVLCYRSMLGAHAGARPGCRQLQLHLIVLTNRTTTSRIVHLLNSSKRSAQSEAGDAETHSSHDGA